MITATTTTTKRLADLTDRLRAVEGQLADPAVSGDQQRLASLGREYRDLDETIAIARRLAEAESRVAQAEELLATERDAEMRALATAELEESQATIAELGEALEWRLLPRDPMDERNLLLEIRAGTGGDEAGLFAGDLLRMYSRFAETRGWAVELLSQTEGEMGGVREVIAMVRGAGAYSVLRYESGVHRVQRVPQTETQGRIHTSAATVAVLPEAEEADVDIKDSDLRIDTMCASGPGGQGVNTTYSAVRVVHLPTNTIVQCQDERSQRKNLAKALAVLRSRLLEAKMNADTAARSSMRKSMVGSGDRSERIRTYNFPQNRITDHRINLTLYNLDRVIEGDLGGLLTALRKADLAKKMEALAG